MMANSIEKICNHCVQVKIKLNKVNPTDVYLPMNKYCNIT